MTGEATRSSGVCPKMRMEEWAFSAGGRMMGVEEGHYHHPVHYGLNPDNASSWTLELLVALTLKLLLLD